MRITYVHQYFVTPHQGGGTRSYYLAKGLVAAGVEVDLVTAHAENYYDLRMIDGIRVHYLPVNYQQEFGFLKRIFAFWIFAWKAKGLIRKLPRPDFLYISSTPLTTGWIGLWAKRKLALPFIFEVRDLWPDAPIEVGVIKNPILKTILYRFEKNIYRHALKIVALSPGIAKSIRAKSPDSQIAIIPNFADTTFFQPVLGKNERILSSLELKSAFTIAYAGAIGKVNAVDELLILAEMAAKKGLNFQFVAMGKGIGLESLKAQVKNKQLKNFYFLPFGNKEKVRDLLAVADMAFVSFAHLPVLKTNSPNKFFDAIAAGKSILVNHKGWVYQMVKDHNLGIYFNTSAPEEALEKLIALSENPALLAQYQKNSRELAEKYFSDQIAVQRLLGVLYPERFGKSTSDEAYILTA
jgi:glycosyltransferase involved in cell wall biosynthesis